MKSKRTYTTLAVLCLISILSSIFTSNAFGAVQDTEKVRIGLFYGTSAVSSFNISAEKGIQIGYLKDGNFNVLVEEPSNAAVSIIKDTNFVVANSVLKEYNPSDKNIPEGPKIGPYHIQIPGTFNDLNGVNQQVLLLKEKGINSFPVYNDGWQIWAGFYTDQKSAQDEITNNIEKLIGPGNYAVTQPSKSRMAALKSNGEVLLVFDSASSRLQIHPKAENSPYVFKLNSRTYRGDLEVRRFSDSDLTLINILPLEHYLYGVVPNEIESGSNPEALKAQAVAARTYTIKNLTKFKKWDFNLCNTTWDQEYKGFGTETPSSNKAVDDTKGKLVMYGGKPAEVFYFSSSGGQTEDARNVFGKEIPYLKSVEDKYESGKSWHYTWEEVIKSDDLKRIMNERGYNLGDIISIEVTKTSEAGRPTELVIKGTKGSRIVQNDGCRTVFSLESQWYTISTNADIYIKGKSSDTIKTQLGAKKVVTATGLKTFSLPQNSVNIVGSANQKKVVTLVPTEYRLNGKGWGHAVGLSQEGAKGMAKAGYKYDEILAYYFPGTTVE